MLLRRAAVAAAGSGRAGRCCLWLAQPPCSVLRRQQHQQQQAAAESIHTTATVFGAAAAAAAASATASTSTQTAAGGRSRAYPDEPRVGVGVVVFRQPTADPQEAEVLLIRRAKEPCKGQWCFPGGSLELGETLAECAAREVLEETSLRIRCVPDDGTSEGFSSRLLQPTPFAAVDSIVHEEEGSAAAGADGSSSSTAGAGRVVKFHYAVIEVAAMAADPHATPVAGDDVDGVRWVRVGQLRTSVENLTASCARLAKEAVQRFDLRPC